MYFTAAGLQILRDNNLIHRDLKPQVWLIVFCLSSNSDLNVAIYILFISPVRKQVHAKNCYFLFFHST